MAHPFSYRPSLPTQGLQRPKKLHSLFYLLARVSPHSSSSPTHRHALSLSCPAPQAGWLPGKAGGTLQWTFISNLGFGVRQGDDIVVVTLIGLHNSVEDRAGVQGRSEAVEPGKAGLGPKDGWMVTSQELLIHLLILLLHRAGSARET